MVDIPIQIPLSLAIKTDPLGPHFCLVEKQGKNPNVGGQGWQTKEKLMCSTDPTLQTWFQNNEGNYGVVGGFGLVIVDVDSEELKQAVLNCLPQTFTVQSPGSKGWHLYYIGSLENPIRLRDQDGNNIGDIQGPGKMVVGPNCIHPNGGIYTIVDDRPLAQITRKELLIAFKDYIVPDTEIRAIEINAGQEKHDTGLNLDILQVVPLTELKQRGQEYYGPHPVHGSTGGQNFWVNPSKNCWHCFRHGSGGGPLLWVAVEEGLIDCADARPGALRGEIYDTVLDKVKGEKLIDKKQLEESKAKLPLGEYFRDKKFIPPLLAEDIMDTHHFITMMDNEELFIYQDGYYQPEGEILVKQECKNRLQDQYRIHYANEVIAYIKASTYTRRKEEPPNLLPLENGILDLTTKELHSYSPEYMFFNKLAVKYDPEATCPNIKQFHEEITQGPEEVSLLEEVLGFCLYRDYFIAKALMLIGDGSNGKSTWLALAKIFLGYQNVSGRSLRDLDENRFAKADLHTKLANIYADIPDQILYQTGMFKMLTGRDLISAERKFQNAFIYVNYAKLLFSANKVPETYDDTSAFFRRWIILVFPNTFTGENADPHIMAKLTTEQELSGLLNLVLAGLQRLLEKGEFGYNKTAEEIKKDYIRKSSPIGAFVMDCIEKDPDAFIVKKELYNVFAQYCREKKLPVVTQTTFFKNLPQQIPVIDQRPDIEGKRLYTFKGLRYSLASSLSSVSRVFYILIQRKDDFEGKEGYYVEPLSEFAKVTVASEIMLNQHNVNLSLSNFLKKTPRSEP